MSRVNVILSFWFEQPQDNEQYYNERRRLWFASTPQIDREIRNRFLADYQAALAGQLKAWQDTPRAALALILLYDQFPRNMFRGDPQAFATDPLARQITDYLIQIDEANKLPPVEQMFVYLPLMHSEDIADQRRSVTFFRQLAQHNPSLDSISYALRHLEIIERFGRFPPRNAILGRISTPEELAFLAQPGSSF
jgi:uncharacterized protein (DUF924 family)